MEEIFNVILEYIPANYLFICLGLIVIGEMLKKFTVLPNQLLTTVLPILGAVVSGITYSSGAEAFTISELIKQICIGLFMGWSATGGFEWFKNIFIKKITTTKTIQTAEIPAATEPIVEETTEEETVEETNTTEESVG